jgi:hypothetical protein
MFACMFTVSFLYACASTVCGTNTVVPSMYSTSLSTLSIISTEVLENTLPLTSLSF